MSTHEERWGTSIMGIAVMDYDLTGPEHLLWKLANVIRIELKINAAELRELVSEFVTKEWSEFKKVTELDTVSMWLQLLNSIDEADWNWFLNAMTILKVKCELPEHIVRDARSCIVLEDRELKHIPRNQSS